MKVMQNTVNVWSLVRFQPREPIIVNLNSVYCQPSSFPLLIPLVAVFFYTNPLDYYQYTLASVFLGLRDTVKSRG